MTKYVFDHFEVNGEEVFNGPQITISLMSDAQVTAFYIEDRIPVPPTDLSKLAIPIIVIAASIIKEKG